MIDRDRTGLTAATIALGLAAGAWMAEGWTASHPSFPDPKGMEEASATVLEGTSAGQPVTWRDGKTGLSATITPATAWHAAGDTWCREYRVAVAGQPATSHIACRDRGGRWSGLEASPQQLASN